MDLMRLTFITFESQLTSPDPGGLATRGGSELRQDLINVELMEKPQKNRVETWLILNEL